MNTPSLQFYIFFIIVLMWACDTKQQGAETNAQSNSEHNKGRPVAIENDKIFMEDGRKMLWGGQDSTWHFDITNSTLVDSQYHYGIGREHFDALIEPEFTTLEQADEKYNDEDRFLLLEINGEARAYGIDLLTHHEVVNDNVGGKPVMAAYCILADLGAVYDRRINGRVHTFALTGYTYYDPQVWDGMDGFVLWDRETESTWWPLIGKAVSGPLLDTPMKVWDEQNWKQTTWGKIKQQYDEIDVLKHGQKMDPPENWPSYDVETDKKQITAEQKDAIAPRWGENSR